MQSSLEVALVQDYIELREYQKDLIKLLFFLGGLSTASMLSKAGKKVLVLEQHDQVKNTLYFSYM